MAGAVTDGWFDFRIEESPSGSINISALDLDGAPPPGGSVAEFQFTLINVGSTDLKLVGLGGVGDITLTVPSSFDAFAPDPVTNSSITVQASTQIPNPASLLLVGLALALLGWTRRNAGARSVG